MCLDLSMTPHWLFVQLSPNSGVSCLLMSSISEIREGIKFYDLRPPLDVPQVRRLLPKTLERQT